MLKETSPFVFAWNVSKGGYRWVKAEDGETWVIPVEDQPQNLPRRTFPLEDSLALFREFRDLAMRAGIGPGGENEIVEFASRYGALGIAEDVEIPGLGTIQGERMLQWRVEASTMAYFIELWEAAIAGNMMEINSTLKRAGVPREWAKLVDRHGGLVRVSFAGDDVPFERAFTSKHEATRGALRVIGTAITNALSGRVSPVCVHYDTDVRMELRWMPDNLLACMWLQLALALDGVTEQRTCPECGSHFIVNAKRGTRRSRKYCSERCKSASYRKRQDRARELAGQGMKPAAIVKKLGGDVDPAAVRRWIKKG